MLPPETALLEQYDVARPTMREALRILQSDGLIVVERGMNGGARVQRPTIRPLARRVGLHLQLRGADLQDLHQAQAIIQPGVVALAATARTDADLERLRECLDEVRSAAAVDEYVKSFNRFLDALFRASHNETLTLCSQLTAAVWQETIDTMVAAFGIDRDNDWIRFSVEQCTTLLELIEAGDAAGAEQFWRGYLQETAEASPDDPVPVRIYPKRRASGRR